MNVKSNLIALTSFSIMMALSINSHAGQLLKCEKRTTGRERSRISVNIEDQTPGALYTALVTSKTNTAQSTRAANFAGKAEFDFDSNRKDVAAGATQITKNFIDGTVSVMVTDALGNVVEQDTMTCKIK
ncbi:hypothetical protein [Methylocucumis oryzae]|uniref:Big-1 domain-containing protein n=1 Tax=Methylocucumis oryzae TaxID=1632867 RepID=A0A0F3IMN0_9GAMM|nr:hypothetical protein [Methylocucumis oryzae]KJV07937.1 hypothetical protein VZ94_01360 [Methylocucumis oryzae]